MRAFTIPYPTTGYWDGYTMPDVPRLADRPALAALIASETSAAGAYIPLWNDTPTAAWFRSRLRDARFEPRYAFMWIRDWRQ